METSPAIAAALDAIPPVRPEEEWSEINTALIRIMRDLPPVPKTVKRDSDISYAFRGIEDILPLIQPLMVRHGVVFTSVYEVITDESYSTRHGTPMRRVTVRGYHTFTAAADGSKSFEGSLGEAADASDKAMNKAQTGARKNCLVDKFLINGGDDPDYDRPEGGFAHRAPAAPPAPAIGTNGRPVIPPEDVPNFTRLNTELRAAITEANLGPALKVWAAEQDPPIDMTIGKDDARLALVIEHAEALLAAAEQDAAAEGPAVPLDPDTGPETAPTAEEAAAVAQAAAEAENARHAAAQDTETDVEDDPFGKIDTP